MYYTSYRPQQFSEILSPNEIVDSLLKQLSSNKVSHAYLFIGPRGTGKTTVARLLSKAINCLKPEKNGDACNLCVNCLSIQNASFVDLIEIDAASNRGIDDIRALREKVKLLPVVGKNKVYIIDEVHMLTTEAFNALLKTLEEPPKHVTFILCTTEEHKVPETIKSRCLLYKFRRATLTQLVAKLSLICKTEGVDIYKTKDEFDKSKKSKKILLKDIETIAKAAKGGFRDAETMLEQFIEGGINTTIDDVLVFDVASFLVSKNLSEALSSLRHLHSLGTDLSSFTSELLNLFRDVLFAKSGVSLKDESIHIFVENSVDVLSFEELTNILEILSDASNKIKTYPIPELALEIAFVKLCSIANGTEGKSRNKPSSGNTDESKKDIEKSENSEDEDDFSVDFIKTTQREVEDTTSSDLSDISDSSVVELVVAKWDEIVKDASKANNSVSALLKASRPLFFVEGELTLEVTYKFHKERIENIKNRELVEAAIKNHVQNIRRIKCCLSQTKPASRNKFETGDLTDLNVGPVGNNAVQVTSENLLGIFDGGLPM